MAVTSSDIKWFKPLYSTGDGDSLGNRKAYNEIASAVMNNLFPNVSQAERTQVNGLVRYRKFFVQNINTGETEFENVKVWIDFDSSGGDYFRIAHGTYIDTQLDAKDYYGGELFDIGAISSGAISVGDEVTGGTNAATGVVEAISENNYVVLRNISSPIDDTVIFESGEKCTKSGGANFTLASTATPVGRFIGSGLLATTPITATNTSFVVEFGAAEDEHSLKGRILPGDELVITNLEDMDDAEHNMEFVTIESISWNGTKATITITEGTQYSYALSYSGETATIYTRICQVIDVGSLVAVVDNLVDVSTGGTLNDAQIVAHNKGSITDTITVTFTSTTAFTVAGSSGINYGSGSIAVDFKPINANTSSFYFTIPTAAWSGTFIKDDYFTFDIAEAAQGIWAKEVVPQNTSSTSRNSTWFAVCGESA